MVNNASDHPYRTLEGWARTHPASMIDASVLFSSLSHPRLSSRLYCCILCDANDRNDLSSIKNWQLASWQPMPRIMTVLYSLNTDCKPCLRHIAEGSSCQQRGLLSTSEALFGSYIVIRASVYDRRTFSGLRHDVQLMGDLLGINRPLYVSQHGQLSHSSSWVDKWVVSWTQAFVMRICVVAPPGECLRVKADNGVVCRWHCVIHIWAR